MAANSPRRSIFRSKTMQKYMQNREKSVLPRFVAPSVFAFCWVVLMLLIAAGITIWFGKVPLYLAGSGVVLDSAGAANDEATAVILLPANDASRLHSGLPVQIQIGQGGISLTRSVDVVSQDLLSPGDIRQKYGLEVSGPSLVVRVGLGSTISTHLYAGSIVQAQIQIGSQSLLALFPVVSSLLKDR